MVSCDIRSHDIYLFLNTCHDHNESNILKVPDRNHAQNWNKKMFKLHLLYVYLVICALIRHFITGEQKCKSYTLLSNQMGHT